MRVNVLAGLDWLVVDWSDLGFVGSMVDSEGLHGGLMEALEGLHKGSVAVLESRCKGLEGFESLHEDSIVVFTIFIASN